MVLFNNYYCQKNDNLFITYLSIVLVLANLFFFKSLFTFLMLYPKIFDYKMSQSKQKIEKIIA